MKISWRLLLLALGGAAFAAFMIWSVLYESLLPLIEAGEWGELALNLVGIPMIFGGTALFVWGAWTLLRQVFTAQGGWKRPLWLFLSGILLIAAGSWMIN